MLGQYVDLGNPMATHPLNDERVLWLYGLRNPYTGGMYWRDLTNYQNSPVLVGGQTWAGGHDRSVGIDLNGSSQYADFGNNVASLKITTAFTMAGWFRTTSSAQKQILSVYSQNSNPAGIMLGVNVDGSTSSKLGFISGNNAGTFRVSNGPTNVNDGLWHHGAVTWDTATPRVYLDGNLAATGSAYGTAPVYNTTTYCRVGNYSASGSALGHWLGGLADVSMWGRALSASEVFDLYAISSVGYPPGGPLRYWSRKTWVMGGASAASATNYTLTAAAGSFSLSGQAASLKAARKVTAAAGSFALAGQPATLRAARKVTASAGRFSLNTSGEAVYTTPGTYAWTVPAGVTAITVEGIGPGGRGASVNDRIANGFGSGGGGAYARSTNYAVTPGETLEVGLSDPATAGIDEIGYAYLSRPSPLTWLVFVYGGYGPESGGGGGAPAIDCTYNDIAYSGGNGVIGSASGSGGGGGAGLTGAGSNASGATPGAGGSGNPGTGTGGGSPGWDGQSYGGGGGSPQTGYADPSYRPIGGGGWLRITWTGAAAAGLRADRKVTAAAGSFAMAGQDAGLRAARTVTASVGTFTIAGQDASLRAARTLTASVGAFALTGQAAGLSVGRTLVGGCGVFGVAGQDAGLRVARTLTAGAGAFVLTGYAAGLRWSNAPAVIPDARWSNRSRSVAYAAPGRDVRWEAPNRTPTWEPPP